MSGSSFIESLLHPARKIIVRKSPFVHLFIELLLSFPIENGSSSIILEVDFKARQKKIFRVSFPFLSQNQHIIRSLKTLSVALRLSPVLSFIFPRDLYFYKVIPNENSTLFEMLEVVKGS